MYHHRPHPPIFLFFSDLGRKIPHVRKRLPKFPLVQGHESGAVALLSLIMLLQRRYLLLLERAAGRGRPESRSIN